MVLTRKSRQAAHAALLLAALLLAPAALAAPSDVVDVLYEEARATADHYADEARGAAAPLLGPAAENATEGASRADQGARAIAGGCFGFGPFDARSAALLENATRANETLESDARHAGRLAREPRDADPGAELLRAKGRLDALAVDAILAADAALDLTHGIPCRLGRPYEETLQGAAHDDAAEGLDAADDVAARATGASPGLASAYAGARAEAERPFLDRGVDPYDPFPPPDVVALVWNEACPHVPDCTPA